MRVREETLEDRAMLSECFYRHGDECRPTCIPPARWGKCWKRDGFAPVHGCRMIYAKNDQIAALQGEVTKLRERKYQLEQGGE